MIARISWPQSALKFSTIYTVINIKNLATFFGSLNHHQTKYENSVLVHSNIHISPDDRSFEPKHVAKFLILITTYIVVLLTGINYIIAMHNKMAPVKILAISIFVIFYSELRKSLRLLSVRLASG